MDGKERTKPRAKARARVTLEECRRGDGPTANKNLALSLEARERLGLYALKSGHTEGEIVDSLICASPLLRRFVISDRGQSSADPDSSGHAEGRGLDPPDWRNPAPLPALEGAPPPEQGRAHPRARRTAV